tara:strand:+ start:197 stop:682 length:486 start_codon:yes stop_codon:yes gene_type:complete
VINRLLVIILFLSITFLHGQNDTIFARDTIISSVRIIDLNDNLLRYFFVDSNKKVTSTILMKDVNRIHYENESIEIFCDLISTRKFLGREENVTINYGNRDSLWTSKAMFSLLASDLKKYNSVIDALNYMGSEGWKEISSYSTSNNSYIVKHYVLKKEIKK